MVIESNTNQKIKFLRYLYTKKGRDETGLFVVEGVNMVKDIPQNVDILYYYVSDKKVSLLDSLPLNKTAERIVVKEQIFDRACDTVTPSGIVAVCKVPKASDWHKSKSIMVLDGVSDMGNVGTIIRTAGACGIDSVLLLDSCDPYAPKCVRSTMGGIFRVNVVTLDYCDFDWDGDVYLLDMKGVNIFDCKPSGKYAVVVGSEAKGASEFIRKRANKVLSIPMVNNTESLNAGVSASLSMYILEHNRRY